jgi:hypothetical protein
MKKTLSIILEEDDLLELMRVLLDDDAESALAFLKQHTRRQVRELLDNTKKIKINRSTEETE